jgi:hypothetical protein
MRNSALQRQRAVECNLKHGDTRNDKMARLYVVWRNMRSRCENQNSTRFEQYGGRGITVYEAWRDYPTFKAWAQANGYADSLVIDRIDNGKGYAPDNCRFITYAESNCNRRDNALLCVNGETVCAAEWERRIGWRSGTISGWISRKGSEYAIRRVASELICPQTAEQRRSRNGIKHNIRRYPKELELLMKP